MTREYFEAIQHKSLIEMAVLINEELSLYKDIVKDLSERTCEGCKNYKPSHKAYKYAVCEKIGNVTVPYDFYCKKWETSNE